MVKRENEMCISGPRNVKLCVTGREDRKNLKWMVTKTSDPLAYQIISNYIKQSWQIHKMEYIQKSKFQN